MPDRILPYQAGPPMPGRIRSERPGGDIVLASSWVPRPKTAEMFNPTLAAASGARISGWLLAALAAVLSAQLTWQILAPADPLSVPAVKHDWREPTHRSPPESASSILHGLPNWPLFGTPQAAPPPTAVAAPDTQLNLRLLGILASDPIPSGSGFAIIAEGNGPERLFGVGDRIGTAGAIVQTVYPDRVILDRNGRLETLRFPSTDSRGSPAALTSLSAVRTAASSPATQSASVETGADPVLRRSQWLENPESLLRAVQARPVLRGGQLHGLTLRPTQNAREFEQAGLEPGDVLTSVNGVPISAIQAPEQLFEELARATQIQLTVERAGETRALTLRLLD